MTDEAADLWGRSVRASETAAALLSTDPDAAASRAYYAAFYAVSAWLSLQGRSFARHSAVEASVHRDLVRPGHWSALLGKDYSLLRALRATADYGGGLHVSGSDAKTAVASARGIIEAVRQLRPDIFADGNGMS